MPQNSKRIVVDTDIASSAAGELAYDARPKQCRDFLNAVKDNRHSLVITEAIHEEWQKHQSNFTRTWLKSMYARRLVSHIEAPADGRLRLKVKQAASIQTKMEQAVSIQMKMEQEASIQNKQDAMLKDVHLLEAALQTDNIVASLDETVRQYFHKATSTIVVLKRITWVNPCKDEETAIEWLEHGAEQEKERCLGYNIGI
ncbi:MAG: hypothetical protein ACYDER_15500 [Ktedonobacteraceae bacterium]